MTTPTHAEAVVRLRDICDVSCGMPSSRAKAKDASGKGLMAVTFPSILPGRLEPASFQPMLANDRAFESLAVPGTILMKSVPPFAAALVPAGLGEAFVGSNVIVLEVAPDAPVSKEYLVAYLNSGHCADSLMKLAEHAQGRLPMVRTSQVRGMAIPVPSPDDQRRLADLFFCTSEISHHLETLHRLEWERFNTVFFDVVDR